MFTIQKVNQNAVRFTFPADSVGQSPLDKVLGLQSLTVPAANIGLHQTWDDGSVFDYPTYLEFALEIGGQPFYYVLTENASGLWQMEITHRIFSTQKLDKHVTRWMTQASMAQRLLDIFTTTSRPLPNPGKVYDMLKISGRGEH